MDYNYLDDETPIKETSNNEHSRQFESTKTIPIVEEDSNKKTNNNINIRITQAPSKVETEESDIFGTLLVSLIGAVILVILLRTIGAPILYCRDNNEPVSARTFSSGRMLLIGFAAFCFFLIVNHI